MSKEAKANLYTSLQELSTPALKLASYSAALYVTAFMLGWVYLYGYFHTMGADWVLGTVPVTAVAIEALLPCYAVLASVGLLTYLKHTGRVGNSFINWLHRGTFGMYCGSMIVQLWLALERPTSVAGLPIFAKAALALYVAASILKSAINLAERRTVKSHEIGFWLGVMLPLVLPASLYALGAIQGKVDANPRMSNLVRVVQPNNDQPCEWVLVRPITGDKIVLAHLRWPLPPTLMIAPADHVMVSNIPGCLTEKWGPDYYSPHYIDAPKGPSTTEKAEPDAVQECASENNASGDSENR